MARGRKMQEAAEEPAHAESSKGVVSFMPKVGSVVEVMESHGKGVWYIAKVLGYVQRTKAHVEYSSLVKNGQTLSGFVNLDLIRPLAPREKMVELFDVGHVVDGYYQDGWWTGVITGVMAGGLSFAVTFLNEPDQHHAFGSSKLRFHREWVAGKWEKIVKRDPKPLLFGAGKTVEVVCGDHFIPATVVEERGDGLYFVHCGRKRETSVIRPPPPPLKGHIFRLGDKVDASLESAWWCGTITQQFPDDSTFDVLMEAGNHHRRFSHAKLRPHLQWSQGKWDFTPRVLPLGPNHTQNQSLPPQTQRRKRKEVHDIATVTSSLGNDDDGVRLVEIATLQNATAGDVQLQVDDSESSQVVIKRRRGRPAKISVISPPAKEARVMTVDQEVVVNAQHTQGSAEEAIVDRVMIVDQEAGVNALQSDMAPTGGSAKEAIVDRAMTVYNDSVKDVEDPTQEVVEFLTQQENPAEEAVEIITQHEIPTQEAVVNAVRSGVARDNIMEEGSTVDNLPFVKAHTSMWSMLESMEPFQKWPQKPHFRPLKQLVECSREAMAIALMVSFANFVQSSSKMELLHEAKSIDKKLLELEENGFDVKVVRDSMAMNGEIAKQTMQMEKLDKNVEDIKMQMKKIQEEMSKAMKKKEAKSQEISSLQLKLEEWHNVTRYVS